MADVDAGRIVLGYQSAVAALRARVLVFIERAWTGLGAWRDADVDRFISLVVPVTAAGQLQVAALTDAYLAQLATALLGAPPRRAGVRAADTTTEALRGTPTAEVWRRPAVTTWTALAAGDPLEAATAKGLHRALDIASTDLQLAKTHTARKVLANDDRVVGYRRVLEGSHSCGLCIVASTQRYHRDRLMPCHPGCDCAVAPIYGDVDPGQVINRGRLDAAHDAVAATFGGSDAGARQVGGEELALQYRDVLVVHEHGEIGPVLGVRGHHFDGPSVTT